jgi:hypothetical protein
MAEPPLLAPSEEVVAVIAALLAREDKASLRASCRALRRIVNSTVTCVAIIRAEATLLPPTGTFPRLRGLRVAAGSSTTSHAQLLALAAALARRPPLASLSTRGHCLGCVQALAAACARLEQLSLWAVGRSISPPTPCPLPCRPG